MARPPIRTPGPITPRPRRPGDPVVTPTPTPAPAPPPTTVIDRGGLTPVRGTGRPGLVVTQPDIVIRPPLIDPTAPVRPVLRAAPPLALLPMRLEYRFISAASRSDLRDDAALLASQDALIKTIRTGTAAARRKAQKQIAELRNKSRTAPRFAPFAPAQEQLWLRWYPDSDFARSGIAAPTAEELAALDVFRAAVGAAAWWDSTSPDISSAWQTLTGAVGPARALHLIRPAMPSAKADDELGRITALPRRIVVFALTGGKAEVVAEGAAIPPNGTARSEVNYTQQALEPGGWLASFDRAVQVGMGVRVTDPARIALAEQADWIVAVGVNGSDARTELDALFADGIANGNFAFLRQDTPTNNTLGERTPYRRWRDDPVDFLTVATDLERRRHDDGIDGAAELLAEAMGLDPAVLRRAVQSSDTAFEDARAMLRAIGPALLDGALDGRTAYQGIDENTVIDVLAAYVCSRGALPAVMLGKNAYGVLPVTLNAEAKLDAAAGFTKTEAAVLSRLNQIGNFLVPYSAARAAAGGAAVLDPDAPAETPARFEHLLQNARTSRRIELLQDGKAQVIGCPYVFGRTAETQPAAYLASLRAKSPSQLPDPGEDDRTWPLLYRLARLTMTRNVTAAMNGAGLLADAATLTAFEKLSDDRKTKVLQEFDSVAGEFGLAIGTGSSRRAGRAAPGRIAAEKVRFAQVLFAAFDKALARLQAVAARPTGAAELETLLMEVFDLFQHRVDALLTGVAFARLRRQRQTGGSGLRAGHYALLGKLRRQANSATSDGYVQAPGMAQATTAAILRSAHLRHRGGGAFNLDLSSGRVRRAMALIDLMAAGTTLPAALGLRAERLLRDAPQNASHLIPGLRRAFPIRNSSGPDQSRPDARTKGPAGAPMLDGLALLQAAPAALPAAAVTTLKTVQPNLADDFDAVSDLIMAEAVHHRAMGAVEAANAWLQVLSGGHVPGRPVFLRTQRTMQASSHRLTIVLPDAAPPADPTRSSPRRSAEPGLAALADAIAVANGGPDPEITLSAELVADPARQASVRLRLGQDLGMEPIDLLVGGLSELTVRAQTRFAGLWRGADARLAALGVLQPAARAQDMAAIVVDCGAGAASCGALLAQLDALRRAAAQGRPLEPADLATAADAAGGLLDAADEAAALRSAADALTGRGAALATALDAVCSAADSALGALRTRLLALVAEIDRDPDAAAAVAAWQAARAALAVLQAALPRLAACGTPQILFDFTVEMLLADGAPLNRIGAAVASITASSASLRGLALLTGTEDKAAARGAIDVRRKALGAALDGEALPVFAPIPRQVATLRPAVGPGTPLPGGFAPLEQWTRVRRLVGNAKVAVGTLASYAGYAVRAEATETPDDFAGDVRTEAQAPRSRHFGTFLADRDPGTGTSAVAGIVVDEWSENRPSSQQDAALAVNYNTPDAQAPNAILLCVAPSAAQRNWDESTAARMVGAVIQQMQARALSSDLRLAQTTLSEDSNVVPPKLVAGSAVKRIPGKPLMFAFDGLLANAGLFVELAATGTIANVGIEGAGLNAMRGYTITRSSSDA